MNMFEACYSLIFFVLRCIATIESFLSHLWKVGVPFKKFHRQFKSTFNYKIIKIHI